ncbi:hypothetical protein PTSG_05166 [Salpingoeca rosetta]|uniref:RING-type domain-containing protein n=1 Tax=Salpingoeca rosetta (strain ATCC 50818 / BSB-021) TaxID=946362 RepID=F2UAP7_SALR5|nr:uncharacterized protein PTSG_05166 [Salpingoeca rosetta]EGD73463.1 hypothetical protein PTSG_05166 [Salpingoeca rosetta]|eukprot:XP_004993745.1 hypothetical protein PTSG_05166 [Salpingoeca rosetta]
MVASSMSLSRLMWAALAALVVLGVVMQQTSVGLVVAQEQAAQPEPGAAVAQHQDEHAKPAAVDGNNVADIQRQQQDQRQEEAAVKEEQQQQREEEEAKHEEQQQEGKDEAQEQQQQQQQEPAAQQQQQEPAAQQQQQEPAAQQQQQEPAAQQQQQEPAAQQEQEEQPAQEEQAEQAANAQKEEAPTQPLQQQEKPSQEHKNTEAPAQEDKNTEAPAQADVQQQQQQQQQLQQPNEIQQPKAEPRQRGDKAPPRPRRPLTPEEEERKKRIEERRAAQEKFEKEHAGHEKMHFEMFLLLIGTLIAAQIVLNMWRRYHFNSYQAVTLVGLWVFPFYFAVRHEILHLLLSWTAFTIATGYIAFKATRPQIGVRTPRLVYTYFYFVIKLTSIVAVVGYFIAILDFVIGHLLPQPANTTLMALGFSGMFYGLYYGVMSRDFADICARRMATNIGYYSATGFPRKQLTGNTCAVCGDRVRTDGSEKRAQLDCGHTFHEFCIRGWCIVGKKQTCPYCKEKVDLARQFPSPWSRTDVTYAQLLDILRYFVVWYPVIINVVQAEYYTLGLK